MRLRVNGKWVDTDTGTGTVAALLQSLGVDPQRPGTAVAVNEAVVPRARWGAVALSEGDRVEVIKAVQGG